MQQQVILPKFIKIDLNLESTNINIGEKAEYNQNFFHHFKHHQNF